MALLKISGGVEFSGKLTWKNPDYIIGQSLRGNRWSSQYLQRTLPAGDRKTWSLSFWIQRSSLEYEQQVFYSYPAAGNASSIRFDGNKRLVFAHFPGSLQIDNAFDIEFSDSNGWYHVLFVYDTTQSFRYKGYVNGVEADWIFDPSLLSENYETYINGAAPHRWFQNASDGSSNLAGAFADPHFLDGIAAEVSDFGYFDNNGVWQPIEYTGSYGTNGVHLDFADSSNLGNDVSGNNNDFAATGYSSGDFWQLPWSPTVNNKQNPAKFDGTQTYAYAYLSRGGQSMNANTSTSSPGWRSAWSTIGFEGINSGKWYWEVKRTFLHVENQCGVGLSGPDYHWSGYYPGQIASSWGLYCPAGLTEGRLYNNNVIITTLTGFGNFEVDDVIGVAFDADNGNLWFSNNGTWWNSGDPANGTNPTATGLPSEMIPVCGAYTNQDRVDFLTHEDDLEYSVPSGFKALMHQNMTNQTILDGEEHFQAVAYTGDGELSQSITGLKFQPDMIWFKNRDATNWHTIYDSTRGVNKQLFPNESNVENTPGAGLGLLSFDSTGFTVGSHSAFNGDGEDIVAWCWKAGTGGVTNNDGTIAANVNANVEAGFSIITYTGNGISGATIGHGLGAVPYFIIIKNRDNANDWVVYHRWTDQTAPENYFMSLNDADGRAAATSVWNDTAPTSSVITLGNDGATNSASAHGYVAYVWAPVPGYSRFGTYVGLGDANAGAGPHSNTGFKPAALMIKSWSAVGSWVMHDNARDTINTGDKAIFADLNNIEQSTWIHEFVSNGFKINHANANANGSNVYYTYASFGKTPQRIARGGRK